MKQRTLYAVVSGKNRSLHDAPFEQCVQEWLDAGWNLQGGIAFDHHNQRFFQAMTKVEEIHDDE